MILYCDYQGDEYEITIDKADFLVIFGQERFSSEKKAHHIVSVHISSNTNIDQEKWKTFLAKVYKGKCRIKLEII